jgi:hypothetical protein
MPAIGAAGAVVATLLAQPATKGNHPSALAGAFAR